MSAAVGVLIDETKCSGHGRCYTVAPGVFDCDDEGFPVVLIDPIDSEEAVVGARTAVASCPEQAITIVESTDG